MTTDTTVGRPHVVIVALGGTIASSPGVGTALAKPQLGAEDLIASVPTVAQLASVSLRNPTRLPSCDLTFDIARTVAVMVRQAVAAGADAVVVTQGTDTIEEMSFCLDLLLDLQAPVVVTGAMRYAGLPGSDGPANLLDAIRVGVSAEARGLGVLVTANEQVHAALAVRKAHTSSPAAFCSPGTGPLGWIAEGVPHLRDRPCPRVHLPVGGATIPPVALVKIALGDDGWWINPVREHAAGLVLEAMGGGHLPGWLADQVAELAAHIPVVLTSRTGGGEVLTSTYGGFAGSESSLLAAGLLPAGMLPGPKARVLLALALAAGVDRKGIERALFALGRPGRRGTETLIIDGDAKRQPAEGSFGYDQ